MKVRSASTYKKFDFIRADKSENEKTALYILGGAHDSQLLKFQKAAELYKQGVVPTVCVMHMDGITAYDTKLGRNLTEDEWTVRELTRVGVPPEAIGFLEIETGVYGINRQPESNHPIL